MDIHIVVEKPEYMILSERAAELKLQIGHYCTRLVRQSLEEETITQEYEKQIKKLKAKISELSEALTAAEELLESEELEE